MIGVTGIDYDTRDFGFGWRHSSRNPRPIKSAYHTEKRLIDDPSKISRENPPEKLADYVLCRLRMGVVIDHKRNAKPGTRHNLGSVSIESLKILAEAELLSVPVLQAAVKKLQAPDYNYNCIRPIIEYLLAEAEISEKDGYGSITCARVESYAKEKWPALITQASGAIDRVFIMQGELALEIQSYGMRRSLMV